MIALISLHDEHPAEFERELISLGLRWRDVGSPQTSWRDVWAAVKSTPPTSPLYVSIFGADSLWSLDSYLLALVADLLQGANYQRGGGKGKKPKPLPRPGTKAKKSVNHHGTPRPVSEMVERIKRRTGMSPI